MREQEGDAPAAAEMPSGACSAPALIAVHSFSVNLSVTNNHSITYYYPITAAASKTN